ncbi:MAG: DUF896 domain-containing protein [Erysipelotrichales bacterium]
MAEIPKELIDRINFLAHKKKGEGLTNDELKEQQELREEYIKIFRAGFKDHLMGIKVIDEEGNDVTPDKLKKEKAERDNK